MENSPRRSSFMSPRMKKHQDLYKKTPDWKAKYKERCRDRLKCGRTRLLEQFRGIKITAVDHIMKETAKESGLTNNELDKMLDIFNEIRSELLEDFNQTEGEDYIRGENVEMSPAEPSVPCPGCAGPLDPDDDYPTCTKCQIIISVPASVLAESYQEWFSAHALTGCDWPPDVKVIATPNNTGQVQISCDGCDLSNIIPHLIVKRLS